MRTRPGWTPGTAPSALITWDPLREDVDRVWGSLASAPPATALVDPEGEFLRLNLAFVELTGHSEAELRALGFTALLHPDDRDADAEYLQRLLDGELAAYQIPQRCRRADGEVVWVLASAWLTTDADGRPAHTDLEGRPRYVVRQLAELGLGGQAAEQVAGRAARDPLTGLPTRALFLDRVDAVLARLERHPGLVAVLVLDLDRFAQAAERVGVDAADGVLVAVAGRLRGVLRPSDTVGRLGSDEFAVLCQDLRDGRDAVRLAERIASGLDTPFAVGGTELTLDASVGIALTGSHRRRARHLLRDGQLKPAEFVPAAEETGLIVTVGGWVLDEACRQAARWDGAGGRIAPKVHVNLSERQFAEAHLTDRVAAALAGSGIDPARLCLEVNEQALAGQPSAAAATCERLAALGVGLAVDDFGTGCSSLASLRQLPLTALKIDHAFVAGLDREPPDDAVATAVIGLAHSLGLVAVAEGVETRRQLARLDALGCDQAQGHLFAAPEPGGRVGELLGQDRDWQ